MSSVFTQVSSAVPGAPQSIPATPTPVVGAAEGARAGALPPRTTHPSGVGGAGGSSKVPVIEERES
eukprot:14035651-Alexandrium_andersonii.AAC.1